MVICGERSSRVLALLLASFNPYPALFSQDLLSRHAVNGKYRFAIEAADSRPCAGAPGSCYRQHAALCSLVAASRLPRQLDPLQSELSGKFGHLPLETRPKSKAGIYSGNPFHATCFQHRPQVPVRAHSGPSVSTRSGQGSVGLPAWRCW
jgi:hypothetical protein